jgi:hypothetical protein
MLSDPLSVILEMDDLTGFATFTRRCARACTFSVRLSSLYPSCVRSHHPGRNTSTSWRTSSERGYADGPDSWQCLTETCALIYGVLPYSHTKGVFVRGVTEGCCG